MNLPSLRKLYDARVAVSAVSIGNEDVAVRSNGHRGGLVESVLRRSRGSGLAEGHQDLSIGTEFENLVAFSFTTLAVGHPNISVFVHSNAVRKNKHLARQNFSEDYPMDRIPESAQGRNPAQVLAPHLSATQMLPWRSTATPAVEPQVRPAGSFAQFSMV